MGKDYNVVFFDISSSTAMGTIFYTSFSVVLSQRLHVVNRRNLQLIRQNLHFIAKTYMG